MFGKNLWASSRRTRRGSACGLWLAPGLLLSQSLAMAAPAPGTVVTTVVTASYGLADSTNETSQSNAASFVIGRAGGVLVVPAASAQAAAAGQTVCAFPVLIQNTGSGSDQFAVKITVPDGWSAVLTQDTGGNGSYQPSETAPLPLPVALDAGQSVHCFVRVTCAAGLDAGGMVSAQLTSQADGAQTALFTGTVGAAPTPPAVLGLGWRVQTGGPVLGEATIHNGIAYVGSDDGSLYAIAATPDAGAALGTVLWRHQTGGRVRCTPAVYVAPNGHEQVSVGNDAGRLTTWDASTGQALWAASTGLGRTSSWRARPLVSSDGSLITVPGPGAYLWSYTALRGRASRRVSWRDLALVGNPTVSEADSGAWLTAANGWGTLVRNGVTGRHVWLGSRTAGALALDTSQNCLVGVTAGGRVEAFNPVSLLPDPRWAAGGGTNLGVSVAASPVLDTANSLLYVAGADHSVYAVRTADGTTGLADWPFTPPGLAGSTFRAAPLLWPSQNQAAPTLYVGDTGGAFYAVPTDHPDQAWVFTPDTGSETLGEWDAAPTASGTGPQDVVVAGNSNGGVYAFHLR